MKATMWSERNIFWLILAVFLTGVPLFAQDSAADSGADTEGCMKAEIFSIGTELLMGELTDTNGPSSPPSFRPWASSSGHVPDLGQPRGAG